MTVTELKWYSVTATYKSIHIGVSRKRHLWERVIFLIQSNDDVEARKAAIRIGHEKEHEYRAVNGDLVRWAFQDIERIQEVVDSEICNGTEVSSEFYERVDK